MRRRANGKSLAKRVAVRPMKIGDRVMTPRGELLYAHMLELSGQPSFAFVMDKLVLGVAIVRAGCRELRYCDPEGIIHKEPLAGHSVNETMPLACQRMAEIIGKFMGERHPLAETVSANRMPV